MTMKRGHFRSDRINYRSEKIIKGIGHSFRFRDNSVIYGDRIGLPELLGWEEIRSRTPDHTFCIL